MASIINKKITDHYAGKPSSEVSEKSEHLHIGGEKATRYFFKKLNLTANTHALDIGCGIGGPARLAANIYGCKVTGIDLTPAFINKAQQITNDQNLSDIVKFKCADATQLDFDNSQFDIAYMIHAGMNIPDKQSVFTEAARVLKPNGIFALFEILALDNVKNMQYPCPWASDIDTSFLENLGTTENYLQEAGFKITYTEHCRDYAISAITKILDIQKGEIPPQRKSIMENLLDNIKKEACAPQIIIAKKI